MPEIPQPNPESEKLSDEQLLRSEAVSEEQVGDSLLGEGKSPLEHYENAAMLEEEADDHVAINAEKAQKPFLEQALRKDALAEQAMIDGDEKIDRGRSPHWEYTKAARLSAEADDLRGSAKSISDSIQKMPEPDDSEIEQLQSKLNEDISDEERDAVLSEIEKRQAK